MGFIRMRGIPGKIYVPDVDPRAKKKHDCDDCFDCQWCNDSKCEQCLRSKKKAKR